MDYIKEAPNSSINVATTLAPVYEALLFKLKEEIEGLNHVFSPTDLSYETVLRIYRDERNRKSAQSSVVYPLLAFNRTPLQTHETLGKRASQQRLVVPDLTDADKRNIYFSALGFVESDFTFFAADIDELMRFEIAFVSQTGISAIRHVSVDIPDVGTFTYQITWEQLNALESSGEGNSYLCVSGRFRIDGLYVVFEASQGIIKEIRSTIRSVFGSMEDLEKSEVLSTDTISS